MTDTQEAIDFTDLSGPDSNDSEVETTENENETENKYPIIRRDVPYGETPEGTMTVTDFAAYMTRKRLEAHMRGEAGFEDFYVLAQNIYQKIKAKRDPLPHVVVEHEVDTTDSDGNVTGKETKTNTFILVNEAEAAWDKPRVRGRAAKTQDDSVEGRLLRAGKAFAKLTNLEKRLVRVQEQLTKQRDLASRYERMLEEDEKTRDDAIAAFEAAEEKAEADKAISDNE